MSHTLPGIGLTGGYAAGDDGWGDAMNLNLRLLSALLKGAKSRVTALPGTPTDGDIYIVPSGGDANKVAIRDAGTWTLFVPTEGVRLWVEDEDATVLFNGTSWVVETIGIKDDATTAYTLAITDAHRYVRMNNASANTVTVPPNSSVAFPIGARVPVFQRGAGQTTIVAGSGVTINTPETLKLRGQYSTATLTKVATNEWDMAGDLEAAP